MNNYKIQDDEKGVITSGAIAIDDIAADAAVILYHHRSDLFGVVRVLPKDAMIPNSTSQLDKKLVPTLEAYAKSIKEPLEQVRVKVYGGDYKFNIIERDILIGKHQNFLAPELIAYLEDFELHSLLYVPTENRTIKTLVVRPNGLVKVFEDEELLEINMCHPTMSWEEYQFRREKNFVR